MFSLRNIRTIIPTLSQKKSLSGALKLDEKESQHITFLYSMIIFKTLSMLKKTYIPRIMVMDFQMKLSESTLSSTNSRAWNENISY